MPQTWGDIAAQLDANMPQEQYDALRDKYFNDKVAPKIRPGFSVDETKKQFIEKTQRPSTVSTADKFLIKAGQFTSAAMKGMLPGEAGRQATAQLDESITPIAEREGIKSPALETVGTFVGQGIALEALLPAAGFIAGKVLPSAIEGGKAAAVAQKLTRGGLAFATYDTLEADEGDRVAAAIKGGALGVAGEAVLGKLFGFGPKAATLERDAARTMTKDAVTNQAPAEIQKVVSEGLVESTEAARAAGVTKGPMNVTPSKRGLAITLTDETGKVATIPLPQGEEDNAIALITKTLERGGSFDEIAASPRQTAKANRIIRALADKVDAEAKPTVGAAPNRRLKIQRGRHDPVDVEFSDPLHKELFGFAKPTPKDMSARQWQEWGANQAHQQKRLSTLLGVPENELYGIASDYRKSVIEQAKAQPKTAPQIGDLVIRAEAPAGVTQAPRLTADPVEGLTPLVDARGAVKESDFPDTISWKAYQLGELRHQVREAGANKVGGTRSRGGRYAPGSPALNDEGHRLMNDLARDVGQDFGLYNRDEAGDQALSYFGKVKGSTGNIESVTDQMQKYAGTGKYDWTRADMPQFGKEKIDPEGGNLTSNLRDAPRRPSIHPDIPKGQGKEYLKPTPNEVALSGEGAIRERPVGTTKVIPAKGDVGGVVDGTAVFTQDVTRGTVYHERVHQGIIQSGLEDDFGVHVPKSSEVTARDLAKGIRSKFRTTYANHDPAMMVNEAFTHAAEAVRVGNVGALDELAAMDTSVNTVKAFVNETAGSLWEKSLRRDTAATRAFQRRMVDLVRRTSDAPSLALREAQTSGWRAWFDPEMAQWIMKDGDGHTIMKPNVTQVWDHIHGHDPSDFFPDGAHKAYFRGDFGPATPGQTGPSNLGASSPEIQQPALGWESVRALWAPTEASASGVAKKFAQVGKTELGQQYYDAFKGALDNDKKGLAWTSENAAKYGTIMKGVPFEKMMDYGEALAHDPKHWQAMADQLKLSSKDLANMRAFAEFDASVVADGGVSPLEALRSIRAVRAAGGDIEAAGISNKPIAKALSSGALSADDFNVAKITSWSLREGVIQKFIGESLDAIDNLAKMRGADGKLVYGPMQYTMKNFTEHMRGHRDQSGKLIDSLVNGMMGSVEKKGVAVGMKPGWTKQWGIGDSRSAIQTYLKVMATANLGGRPVSFIRDSVSGLLQLSVGGPKMFAEGVGRLMSKEGRAAGEKYLINQSDIAGHFGDTTGELAASKGVAAFNRFSDIALTPTRLGNNVPRMIAGLGEEARALREIGKYRAGKITADDLIQNTGVWFQDPAVRTRLVTIATDNTIPLNRAAESFGHAFTEATQFAMSRGTQGAIFRTGAGKLLGQYGTWPANYANFVRKLAARALENPKRGVPALATFTAMSYGTMTAAKSLSVDVSNWLFFSPIGYSGSPTLSILQSALTAPEETHAGREARKELIQSLSSSVIPLGTQFRSMMKAFEDDGSVNVARLLGFKPLKEQDLDWDEWLKTEAGFKK